MLTLVGMFCTGTSAFGVEGVAAAIPKYAAGRLEVLEQQSRETF
jgi:hypothetical protein